jgi:hypothetical protein
METIEINLQSDSLDLIYEGKKTSLLLNDIQFQTIDLQKGESRLISFKDKQFVVSYTGLVGVDDVGGRDHVWRTEGYLHTSPKFHSVWMFLLGKRQLHHYTLSEYKVEETAS